MRILKLKLTNFIPYFGDDNEIVLFDERTRTKNVTVNIGPTGNGKTSISRAVMWCLFGEQFEPLWESMINVLAIDVAKQTHDKLVKMLVEMEVQIEGRIYFILREGKYDRTTGKRESDTKLYVRSGGEPIKEDSEKFVNEKFLPVGLMEYFIFDADAMLTLFEKNRERTIKDHINKIVGVETLDIMSESLAGVVSRFDEEINDVRGSSPGVSGEALAQENEKKDQKLLAVQNIERRIKKLDEQKRELFPKGRLSPGERRLKELMDRQQGAEEEIKELNKQLEDNTSLISSMYLLYLKEIIEKSNSMLTKTQTTKAEFDSAISTLKSTLDGKYAGVLVLEDESMLIRSGAKLRSAELEKATKLKLGEGAGIKVRALQEFDESMKKARQTEGVFVALQTRYKDARKRLSEARNLLKQVGDNEKNQKLKGKVDKFIEYDNEIEQLKPILEETNLEISKIDARIGELSKDQKATKEAEDEVRSIEARKEVALYMKKVTDLTKKRFLEQLLADVNKNATEFFKGVVRADESRLNSVVVDSDYSLNVKNDKGETIDPSTISKGNTQIALMAFFFGLSKNLQNKLPYIIDDPIIRLDIGHEKRLIQHLCAGDQQIIMHMIPGREYSEYSYGFLKPFINTQNWINRARHKGKAISELKSSVQRMDREKFVPFDIDKL